MFPEVACKHTKVFNNTIVQKPNKKPTMVDKIRSNQTTLFIWILFLLTLTLVPFNAIARINNPGVPIDSIDVALKIVQVLSGILTSFLTIVLLMVNMKKVKQMFKKNNGKRKGNCI
jgi:hypothetical protein